MFGIGIFEILILALLVLLFVQPKNLPSFFYKLGALYKKVSTSYQTVLREMNLLRGKVENWRKDISEFMEMESFAKESSLDKKNKNDKISKVAQKKKNKKSSLKKAAKSLKGGEKKTTKKLAKQENKVKQKTKTSKKKIAKKM